jgi:hypothetical protein
MPRELYEIESDDLPAELVTAFNAMAGRIKDLERRLEALESGGSGMAPIVLAKSSATSLAAATSATKPRKGTATLQVFNGTDLINGPQVEYWNPWIGTNGAVGVSKLLILVRAYGKHLFHGGEQC